MSQNAINDYWNSLTARYQAGPLPDFFSWWKGELSALIPASLRQRMIPPKPVVWLRPDAELQRLEIWPDARADEPRDYYGADEDAGILRNRWHELINDFPDGQPEIRLCLPAQDVLYLPVELPLAVESNLGESLQYQLDQLTPFRPDQVYYDYSIAERNAEHGRLKVDLRMALRPRVDQLLERLASIGIRPHAVDCAISEDQPAGTGKFNLLPAAQRPRHVYRRARINWLLAGALVLVLAVVMVESLALHKRTVTRLQAQVADLRQQADEVVQLQQELEDALLAANFLAERRRRQPVSLDVINELSSILPSSMWLRQMRMQGDKLTMSGLANESQELIDVISESGLLADAEFSGAIRIDPASGRETFNATARIKTREDNSHAAAARSGE